jgi:hypothetical protein
METNAEDKLKLEGLKTGRSGVTRLSNWITKPLLARRGYVAYAVISDDPRLADRRHERRRNARLQSGKVISGNDRFLVDCLFRDRTRFGFRLTLGRRVPLPRTVLIYDDQSRTLLAVTVVWQKGTEAGCKVASPPPADKQRLLKRLEGRYYAMR